MNIFFLGVGLIVVASGFGAGRDEYTIGGETHRANKFRELTMRNSSKKWDRPDDQGLTQTGLLLAKRVLSQKCISFESTPTDEKRLIKALCIVAMCETKALDICPAIQQPFAQKINATQLQELENLLDKVRNFGYEYDRQNVCDSIADKVADFCVSIPSAKRGLVDNAQKQWSEIQKMLKNVKELT